MLSRGRNGNFAFEHRKMGSSYLWIFVRFIIASMSLINNKWSILLT